MRDSAFIGIALYTILPLICFGVFYGVSVNIALNGGVEDGIEWKKSRLWISID
ncbi:MULTISPECIES: hypothetical protein [unclassified Bartonella]|uniref:hypothetical protein n=1 Tax=unclassified Bartonella TaxID=2645622 RepID=UPI0035CEB4DC